MIDNSKHHRRNQYGDLQGSLYTSKQKDKIEIIILLANEA
jgi:hypothetical protein